MRTAGDRNVVLLLSGWKRSGKDTAAQYLVQNYGFVKMAFADALKDYVAKTYKIKRALMDDDSLKDAPLYDIPLSDSNKIASLFPSEGHKEDGKWYATPRYLLIMEGQVKRSVNPEYWSKQVARNIRPGSSYVISDWRFVNELDVIKANCVKTHEVITARIQRFEASLSTDLSERELDNMRHDLVLCNKSGVKELHRQLDEVANGIANIATRLDGERGTPALSVALQSRK